MPSTSTLTSAEKSLIKKHAPTSSGDKILTAAIGRIYYAFPDPVKWSYSGISGAVVFGWGSYGGWLKVIDLAVRLGLACLVREARRELMYDNLGHSRSHLDP